MTQSQMIMAVPSQETQHSTNQSKACSAGMTAAVSSFTSLTPALLTRYVRMTSFQEINIAQSAVTGIIIGNTRTRCTRLWDCMSLIVQQGCNFCAAICGTWETKNGPSQKRYMSMWHHNCNAVYLHMHHWNDALAMTCWHGPATAAPDSVLQFAGVQQEIWYPKLTCHESIVCLC